METELGGLAYAIIGNPKDDRKQMISSLINQVILELDGKNIHDELYRKLLKSYNIDVPRIFLEKILGSHYRYEQTKKCYIHNDFATYELAKHDSENKKIEFQTKNDLYGTLFDDFAKYASDIYGIIINKEDCKTLFANYTFSNRSVLGDKKDEKNFVFSQFIQLIYSGKQTDFRENITNIDKKKILLEDIAAANIMLSKIIPNMDFNECNFYLDTPIILKLLGYWGKETYDLYQEIIRRLKDNKAKIHIFEHNKEELARIIEGLSRNLKLKIYSSPNIDHYKQALKDNGTEGFTCPRLIMNDLLEMLEELKISIKEKPELSANKKLLQFNEKKLEEEIIKAFNLDSSNLQDQAKKRIQVDIDSIQSIPLLRGSDKKKKHVFVTLNQALIAVARNNPKNDKKNDYTILEHIMHLASNLTAKGNYKLISKYIRLSLLDNLSINEKFREKLYRYKRHLENIAQDLNSLDKKWLTTPDIEAKIYEVYLRKSKENKNRDEHIEAAFEEIVEERKKEDNALKAEGNALRAKIQELTTDKKEKSIKDGNEISTLKEKLKKTQEESVRKEFSYKIRRIFLYQIRYFFDQKAVNSALAEYVKHKIPE